MHFEKYFFFLPKTTFIAEYWSTRMTEVDRHQSRNAGKSYSPMTGQKLIQRKCCWAHCVWVIGLCDSIVCGFRVDVQYKRQEMSSTSHDSHTPHPNPDGSPPLSSFLLSSPVLFNMLFLSFKEMKNILRAKGDSFYDVIMSSCIQLDLWAQTESLRSPVPFRLGRKREKE